MAPTPIGLFERLPNELLFMIGDYLSIKDIFSWQKATDNLISALETRTDPSQYFEDKGPFENAEDLLEVMSTHGAVLSGSRALDWFVPGSATLTSDWDFYVPPEPNAIKEVKRALERAGVNFETCLTQAARRLQSEPTILLNRNEIISIAYEGYFCQTPLCSNREKVLDAVFAIYPVLRDISQYIQSDGSVDWIADFEPIAINKDGSAAKAESTNVVQETNPYNGIAPRVLTGTAKKFDRTISIQLVVGALDPRRQFLTEPTTLFQSVLRSIFRFYGSHVQCFLTKHAAVHMYYKLAVERISLRWQVPEVIRERAEAAEQKYIGRGFQFSKAAADLWTHRAALDDDCLLVELSNKDHYAPSLSLIREMEWSHSGHIIESRVGPATREARNELLYFGIINRLR